MKKKTKANIFKQIFGLLMSAFCVYSITKVVDGINDHVALAEDQTAHQEINNTKDFYMVGESYTLPNATVLSYQGKDYEATVILRDPNGKGYMEDTVSLEIPGVYTIEYKAITESGQLLKEEETFECFSNIYSVIGKGASAHYGKFEEYEETENGIAVSLTENAELRFNHIIDLSVMENSYKETVDFQSLIELYVAPNALYEVDARQINVKLTDAHNENNYVTIALKKVSVEEGAAWSSLNTYVTAGATSQMQVGLEKNLKGSYKWEDHQTYTVHKGTQYGAAMPFSMVGGHSSIGNTVGSEKIALGWDNAENRVYAESIRFGEKTKNFISDLDDEALYFDLFEGFTTGEVYLSISCNNYLDTSCRFVITQIAGADIQMIQENYFEDETAPILDVDMQGYASAPDARVGMEYPVFPASAIDDYDKDVKVGISVFSDYGTKRASKITVKNGKFVPLWNGKYTIVYKATNNAKKTTVKTVDVYAHSDIGELNIETDTTLETGIVGEEICVSSNVYGGSGNYTVSVCATHKNIPNVVYEVSPELNTFIPFYSGEYDLIYTYSDYIETKVLTRTLTVSKEGKPYINDDVDLPRVVLKNSTYTFPSKTGIVFVDGKPVETECQLLVRQDNGKYMALSSNSILVTADETLTVAYRLSGNGTFYEIEREIPVVDTGLGVADALDLTKYFQGDFSLTANSEHVLLSASGNSLEYAETGFVNPLQVDSFQVYFATDSMYAEYDSIILTLTDSVDSSVQLQLNVFRNEKGKAIVHFNGREYSLERDFFTEKNKEYRFRYYNDSKTLELTSNISFKVKKDSSGNAFNGFTSGYIYLTVAIDGIKESRVDNAAVRLIRINNQRFSAIKNDINSPEITTRIVRENKEIGDTQDILPVYVADVLDPNVKVEMKVYDPDKNIVIAIDGTRLENCDYLKTYTVLLEKHGIYSVEYYAIDSSGQETIYSYVIKVQDKEAPNITLSNVVGTGKVNETIKLAKAEVSDNVDSSIDVSWFVQTPTGVVLSFYKDDVNYSSFVAKELGKYTVYCYAIDDASNYRLVSYVITIS